MRSVRLESPNGMDHKLVLFLFAAFAYVLSVDAAHCLDGKEVQEGKQVSLTSCESLPCKLRKKTTVNVEVKFTPESDIEYLKNSVHADILGVPFPFIGVDGKKICDKIFDAETGAKVDCPLKPGSNYVYKDEFKVLEVYPKISVVVKWALKDDKNHSVVCFRVPAKIIS